MKTPVAKVALRKLTIVYLVATVSMINARRIHVRNMWQVLTIPLPTPVPSLINTVSPVSTFCSL